jgi:hypothetical protein
MGETKGGGGDAGGSGAPLVVAALLAGAAFLGACSFWLATGQVWEDFYISLRHAANAASGMGLTYRPGERIQGFSSPLAVLLQTLACLLSGSPPGEGYLFPLRLAGAAGHALALRWLLTLIPPGRPAGWFPPVYLAAVFILEPKATAFAVNGMETPFFLAALAGTLAAMQGGSAARLGLAWGALLWIRPDGAVYLLLSLAALILLPGEGRAWTPRKLALAAAGALLVYLPWLLFAWVYYGSPVPQTVIAKGASAGFPLGGRAVARIASLPSLWARLFLPPYAEYGGWDRIRPLSLLVAAVGCLRFLLPGEPAARRASLMALGGTLYLAILPRTYPWYLCAPALLCLPSLAEAAGRIRELRPGRTLRVASLLLVLLPPAILGWSWTDYLQVARATTLLNEREVRRGIGAWLASHGSPRETVFLECPGIIGFFSGLEVRDYPGLVSPETVAARRREGEDMARVALALDTDWMVLRPAEADLFRGELERALVSRYRVETIFDVGARLRERLPGHPQVLHDSAFLVLRHREQVRGNAPD